MGSCVSKKAARAGAVAGGARGSKVAAPIPAAEESARHALPPVAEADVEREEVKEVVLSETPAPRPPRPPPPEPEPEPLKRTNERPEAESEEACSASDTASSVESAAKEKAMAKLQKKPGAEREPEKRVVMSDVPKKKGRTMAPEETGRESKPRGTGNGRARSPSPSSAHRRQQPGGGQQQHPPRPRREHPHVVSGIGCRSGRFSPSAARRAAESVVRRTHSAREADMALPSSKRSLTAAINGGINAGGYGGSLSRRDPGERSGRRSDSPTGSRRAAPASPGATHRPASPMRKAAAKEHAGTPERASRPRVRDGGDEQPPALAGLGERNKKAAEGQEDAALGQNPSVALECFIFL